MQYWSLTDPGCVRSQNQDACRVEQLDKNSVLCVVCDGMGGAKAGNVASALAVDVFTEEVRRTWKSGMDQDRIDQMLEQGLVAEVDGLLKRGYRPELVSMQGIGYKEFIPYLNGECTLEEAVIQLKTNTRRFAKRQLTWFRRQIEGLWLDMSENTQEEAMEKALNHLKQKKFLS